jgi:senataxin
MKPLLLELEKLNKNNLELKKKMRSDSTENERIKNQLENNASKEKRLQLAIEKYEKDKKHQSMDVTFQQSEYRKYVLTRADIICATLGSVAHQELHSISHIIIDESCQCVEPESMVPLIYNSTCKSIALVGDPQQLPATVLSKESSDRNYTQSLMERFLNAGCDKVMLQTQYRMHSSIAKFPSKMFYYSELLNGPLCDTAGNWLYNIRSNKKESSAFHKIYPYQVYDLTYSRESTGGRSKSLKNEYEAEYVINLFIQIMNLIEDPLKLKNGIGIISPYKHQVHEITRRLTSACGSGVLKFVQVATVDAFQGKEKDIIIFSCVRSQSNETKSYSSIGFLNDVRRMNVGITRAKHAMYIVCNAKQLSQNSIWRDLITDAKHRNSLLQVDERPKLVQPLDSYTGTAATPTKTTSEPTESKSSRSSSEKISSIAKNKLSDSYLEEDTPRKSRSDRSDNRISSNTSGSRSHSSSSSSSKNDINSSRSSSNSNSSRITSKPSEASETRPSQQKIKRPESNKPNMEMNTSKKATDHRQNLEMAYAVNFMHENTTSSSNNNRRDRKRNK